MYDILKATLEVFISTFSMRPMTRGVSTNRYLCTSFFELNYQTKSD